MSAAPRKKTHQDVRKNMDIIYGDNTVNDNSEEKNESTSGMDKPTLISAIDVAINADYTSASASTSGTGTPVDVELNPSDFRMPLQAEQTLDLYIEKLQEYYSKIGEEKKDVISQKAKVLEAVLGTDRLNID